MNGKQYINDTLKRIGFSISDCSPKYCDYITKFKISTPDSMVIINGMRQIIPGKIGQIDLMFRISDAECVDNGDKYIAIHSHAFFHDIKLGRVCFGQIHEVIPESDIKEIDDTIGGFLSIFQFNIR